MLHFSVHGDIKESVNFVIAVAVVVSFRVETKLSFFDKLATDVLMRTSDCCSFVCVRVGVRARVCFLKSQCFLKLKRFFFLMKYVSAKSSRNNFFQSKTSHLLKIRPNLVCLSKCILRFACITSEFYHEIMKKSEEYFSTT